MHWFADWNTVLIFLALQIQSALKKTLTPHHDWTVVLEQHMCRILKWLSLVLTVAKAEKRNWKIKGNHDLFYSSFLQNSELALSAAVPAGFRTGSLQYLTGQGKAVSCDVRTVSQRNFNPSSCHWYPNGTEVLKWILRLSFYQTFQINRNWVAKKGGPSNKPARSTSGLVCPSKKWA